MQLQLIRTVLSTPHQRLCVSAGFPAPSGNTVAARKRRKDSGGAAYDLTQLSPNDESDDHRSAGNAQTIKLRSMLPQ